MNDLYLLRDFYHTSSGRTGACLVIVLNQEEGDDSYDDDDKEKGDKPFSQNGPVMREESLLHCAVYVTVTLHVQSFWQGFGRHGLSEIEKKQDNSSILESNLLNFKEMYPNFISITCDKLKI